ncbi:flagellar biosynthesis protein FliQ [Candidatus Ponderosibacter sp. Uisw_141_02]|jgi:flagellar biosynthetic protein FliQ|uniref:flagellar biosynthesis protein FliQ n=1 Tax=Candidatus Ponderosibacter sp. Uisw_141_02 TaxID=3231000 RepID=UPI003D4F5AFB
MGFDANVEFLRMAFWQILVISGPLLGVALAIGLVIGILQAATSIQEMTLTFVPKLVLVVIAFGLLANFMMVQLADYFSFIFDQVAQSA